jgi:putative peptidoglycan lipid II flippase
VTDNPDRGARVPESLARPTAVMAVGTTISRVTGVFRIVALAYALASTSPLSDAYNLANTIPNIIHDIVLGGIVSATFIPVFVERLSTKADDDAWEAISAVATVTLLVLGVATLVFLALTPLIIHATTALDRTSEAPQTRQVATDLLILFVPQLTCYGFISLATALLNARRRFAAPMFAPIANNVILIVVLFLYATSVQNRTLEAVAHDRGQLLFLGLGTTLAVVAQAFLMIPSLRRAGLHLRWRLDFRHEAVRTILRLSGWTFGLVVANQISLLVVLAVSGRIRGGVTAYTYAYTVFQLPFGVVAVSIMSATSPSLAAYRALGDWPMFRRRMTLGLRAMLAMTVPAAAGLVVLARPGMALLLAHGATTTSSTVLSAQSLAMLALGLPGFCVFLYAIRVLQSMQDLRTAFWLYVAENGINVVLAVVLGIPFGVRGIALSISIAYTVAAFFAMATVRTRVQGLDAGLLTRPLGRVAVACVALVVAAALASNVSAAQRGFALFGRVAFGVVAGAAAYFLTAGVLAALAARRRQPPGRQPPDGDGPPPRGARPGGGGMPVKPQRQGASESAPGRPEPLPPAGRPPRRPVGLGPTRRPDPGAALRGKLES